MRAQRAVVTRVGGNLLEVGALSEVERHRHDRCAGSCRQATNRGARAGTARVRKDDRSRTRHGV
jgi:hypothetical protein